MVTISNLVDCPQHLPQVASWIFNEWGNLIQGLTLNAVEAKLQTHLNLDSIPLTLVASFDGMPVGTASLVYQDMSSRPDLTPWLASVYVAFEYRNQGIGSRLVKAAEETAKGFRISQLYLFTPDKERFYTWLGWSVIDTTEYRNQQVVIMTKML